MKDMTDGAADESLRQAARARAATSLGLPEAEVEDDLVDFLTAEGRDVLLRARAGSGKTTALSIKAAFMTLDRGVAPERILILTFNNAAARSLEARLRELSVPDGVRVRTFHALGQRIVRAHFGDYRRCVFDEDSEDGQAIRGMMNAALDEVVQEKFYFFCASRMRTRYDKRRDYVESIGRDALLSAAGFLRTRGYGLQNRMANAWETGGPIAGTAMKLVMAFESRLKEAGLLDSVAVLQAASWTLERELETGRMKPSEAHDTDHVFVDEFQDMSAPFARLIEAIRNINGGATLVGVGDDWQAINGFAGSDLDFFKNAASHMEDPALLDLLRNRRSGAGIVAWGNGVMAEAGDGDGPAVPDPANGEGEVRQMRVSADRDMRYIAERLADQVAPDMGSVALIARKWKIGDHHLDRLTRAVRAALKERGVEAAVTGITAHGSKGLEYDQVFLLDDGSFPLQHPSRPILEALISESDHLREEACLRHVAGTRARRRLDLVTM